MRKFKPNTLLDHWQSVGLMDAATSAALADNLPPEKPKRNVISVVLSVLGALIVGLGVILVGSSNLFVVPLWVKTGGAVLPFGVGAALTIYVVRRKMQELAWREGVAMFTAASVFAAIALVGRLYHLGGDFPGYMLTCGLLILPFCYVLSAVTPTAAVWVCWFVSMFASTDYSSADETLYALRGLALAVLIAPMFFLERKTPRWRLQLLVLFGSIWLGAWGIYAAVAFGSATVVLLVFSLLYLCGLWAKAHDFRLSCTPIGQIGVVVFGVVASVVGEYAEIDDELIPLVLLAAVVAAFCVGVRKTPTLFKDALAAGLMCVLVGTMLPALAAFAVFGYGFLLITTGMRDERLARGNLGLLTVLTVVIVKFLEDTDLLVRGVVFILCGAGVLVFNLVLAKKKKARETSVICEVPIPEEESP